MKRAEVYQQGVLAGILEELDGGRWRFTYSKGCSGEPVSLTMPMAQAIYEFDQFPPTFEGLLPEGKLDVAPRPATPPGLTHPHSVSRHERH